MAVFFMATAHFECKICLLFKLSSVILTATFNIKLRKKGRRPGCFRRYSGTVVFMAALQGSQEMPCPCSHPPLAQHVLLPGQSPQQSRHWAPVPGTAAGGVSRLCWAQAAASAPAGRGNELSPSSAAEQGLLGTQGRIGANLNHLCVSPISAEGLLTICCLPAPGNEEISQGQLLWPPKIWVTKISKELNTRGGWQVG